MNIKLIAERTFNLLKGFGFDVSSYNKEGDLVIDPMEATRFAVKTPNVLVRLDPTEKYLSLKTGEPGELIEKLRPMLKELAQDYLLDFDYSVFDKQIKPKGEKIDVAKKSQEENTMSEDIKELKRLSGLEENPRLQNPPGANLKFGQDTGRKLDFTSLDGQDEKMFYLEVGKQLPNDKDLKKENPLAQQIMKKAYNFYKLNKENPKSAVAQAKLALKISPDPIGQPTPEGITEEATNIPWAMKDFGKFEWESIKPGMDSNDAFKLFIDGIIQYRGTQGTGGYTAQNLADKNGIHYQEVLKTYTDKLAQMGMSVEGGTGRLVIDQVQHRSTNESSIMDNINEASLGKMTGSRKSSYQPLADNVKIIVRHNKEVNEEVRGARSRNIHSILIQRGEEKFKMAENNLSAARAMARHLHNGGETFDEIGEAITEMSREFKKLKEFVNYVRKANLVNETNEEFVTMAMENINTIKTSFTRLSGVKSYANAVESVKAYNNVELLQDDLDLESKFTETHFDDKVSNVMDSLKASASRKNSFESKIVTAIESESFNNITELLKEDDLLNFESLNQQLGHQVSKLGYSAKDETLGNYLHSISGKLNAGEQLSQFEYGAIKSCLLSAGQHNVQSAPMSMEESYEAFLDRFVD